MRQRPIAGGLGSDYPRRRSGRRPLEDRMGERTPGVMNHRHRGLPTSGKGPRKTSTTSALHRWKVLKRATVHMDSTTWLGTLGSGQPIGTMDVSMRRVRSGIRRDHRTELTKCPAVGPGGLTWPTCDPPYGSGSHRRPEALSTGSAVPRTVRNNLYFLSFL